LLMMMTNDIKILELCRKIERPGVNCGSHGRSQWEGGIQDWQNTKSRIEKRELNDICVLLDRCASKCVPKNPTPPSALGGDRK